MTNSKKSLWSEPLSHFRRKFLPASLRLLYLFQGQILQHTTYQSIRNLTMVISNIKALDENIFLWFCLIFLKFSCCIPILQYFIMVGSDKDKQKSTMLEQKPNSKRYPDQRNGTSGIRSPDALSKKSFDLLLSAPTSRK